MKEQKKDFYDLLMDYLTGNLNETERRELLIHLQESPEKRNMLLRMKTLRSSRWIPLFEQQKEKNYQTLWNQLQKDKKKHTIFRLSAHIKQIAAVALLCILCSVGSILLHHHQETISRDTFISETSVPYGSQVDITLPDSSVIRLNAGSSLQYNAGYNKNNRTIKLNGEGYFIVHKNQDIPFIVQVGEMQVKVLGTTFNIKGYEEDEKIEVSLVEGSLNVFTTNENRHNKILAPNEWLVYDKKRDEMSIIPKDAETLTQWQTGRLYFDDATLTEIFKTLERKFNVSIIADLPNIGDERFTGNINSQLSVTGMIDFLNAERKYRWQQEENTIYIRER